MEGSVLTEVVLEELSREGFLSFGSVIEQGWPARLFEGLPYRMLNLGLEVDGTPALYVLRVLSQDMMLSKFERHLTMTESRVSLGSACVMVVAGDTPIADRWRLPDPRTVRAFLMPGGSGVCLRRGAWHGISCFPIGGPYADLAFISEAEAEAELAGGNSPDSFERTHIIDFETVNRRFKVVDQAKLLNRI